MKKVTIKQVAEMADVSKTTISRFLNGHYGNMSQETKHRIEKVIKELDYRPSRQAQALKSKHSFLIGVVVADISNMYASLLLKGVGDVLAKNNYQMVIVDSANSIEREHELIQKLLDQGVEGIILQPCSRDANQYQFLLDRRLPLLLVDRRIEPDLCPAVVTNNHASVVNVLTEVFKQNYQQIVVVTEPIAEVTTREVRYNTVKEMTEAAGKTVQLVEINEALNLREIVLKLAKDDKKTLLFASNGRVLMELLTILAEEKIAIPDDLGITGFDDWKITALVGPGVTSIEQQSQKIGEVAAQKMIDYLKNGETIKEETIVPAKLRWRNSI